MQDVCFHSGFEEDCLSCIERDLSRLQKMKQKILDERSLAASQEHGYYENEIVMPMIDGRSFHCRCRCNVFYMHLDHRLGMWIYICNACGLEYEGVKSA